MNNPFSGSKQPVKRARELIGRQNAAAELDRLVRKRMNAVIMGPEGIGKSSFLNCYFSRDLRRQMAQEEQLLIVRTMFPVHLAGDKVYHYLADAIESSLSILREAAPEDAERIIPLVAEKRSFEIGSSRLQEICKIIDENEYDITLVIDDFENFTSSKSIEMDHHSIMLNLFRQHYASYVVATNYDFNKDSLPPRVSGSFLLMAFSGNEVHLDGFTAAECKQYLEAQGAEGCFTDADCVRMQLMSGGIPALLRITAEAAWNRKQTTPVLDEDAWFDIQDQLFADPRVNWYIGQWCRIFTAKHVSVIHALTDENNRLGLISDQDLTSAANALLARGLLVNRRRGNQILEDCYDFNSDLLADYCFNNVLSAADPYDPPKHNIAKQLREMIDSGETEAVLTLLREVCSLMDNVSLPFDFSAPLTDEFLQAFELNQEVLDSFDPFAREQICSGIRIERTFEHVQMKDYSPVYLSFAKAIEAHLNNTLVPILKKITPNHLLPGGRTLRTITDTLMLGEIHTILSSKRAGLKTVVYEEAAAYCAKNGCPAFDEQWWNNLHRDLNQIKVIRNDMPHYAPLSGSDGVKLLHLLFQGEDSFTYRCACLADALSKAKDAKAESPFRTGAIVTGTVRNVAGKAAFIDIGADRDGFLHISEVKYGYISDLYAELPRGRQVKVKIISFDESSQEAKLSMKDVPQD